MTQPRVWGWAWSPLAPGQSISHILAGYWGSSCTVPFLLSLTLPHPSQAAELIGILARLEEQSRSRFQGRSVPGWSKH